MRLMFVAATIVALLLIACNGSSQSTPDVGPELTPVETPGITEPSPTAPPPTPKRSENILIETPEYTGVIFSEDGELGFSFKHARASISFWTPSIDDVSRAEKGIRQFLGALLDDPELGAYQREEVEFILENLERYRRQYVGIVVNGEKRVWCNAFLADGGFLDWKSRPVNVLDGGRYFWQIEYRPLKDDFVNFDIHGEA